MSCMWQSVYTKITRAAKSVTWRSGRLELPVCKKWSPPPFPHVIAEQRCFIRKSLYQTIRSYQRVILEPLMASYFRFDASGFRCVPGSDLTSHLITMWITKEMQKLFRLLLFLIIQPYMFRVTHSPILRSTFWLYIQHLVQFTGTAADRCHGWDGTWVPS